MKKSISWNLLVFSGRKFFYDSRKIKRIEVNLNNREDEKIKNRLFYCEYVSLLIRDMS